MTQSLLRALGGLALGAFLLAPAWAQETIECPTPTAPATCAGLQTIGGTPNILAPTDNGSETSLSLTGNSVSLTSAGMTPPPSYVYGAFNNNTAVSGNVSANAVLITVGTLVSADVAGGFTNGSGNATGNTVALSNANIGGNVWGGYANGGNATGNSVSIVDSTVSGAEIEGGYAPSGNATGNTVSIGGASSLATSTYIRGGYNASSGDPFNGNTLKLENYTGTSTVSGVSNFAAYEFRISDASQPLKASSVFFRDPPSGVVSSVTAVAPAPSPATLTRPKTPLICGNFPNTIANNGQAVSGGGRSFRIWQENDASLAGNCVYATEAPVLSLGTTPPVPTPSSVKFYIKSNLPGVVHWQLWAGGATCPAASVIATLPPYGTVQGDGSDEEFNELALQDDFAFTVCIVVNAQDALGNEIPGAYSDVLAVDIHTLPLYPAPALDARLTFVSPTSATFSYTSNMPTVAVWTAVTAGGTCPSFSDILTGIFAGDPAFYIGISSTTPPYLLQGSVRGLEAGPSYTLCLVAWGTSNDTESITWSVSFPSPGIPALNEWALALLALLLAGGAALTLRRGRYL